MFEKIRYWWQDFILRQFHNHYQVGGHCGLCGRWIPNAIVYHYWAWTVCPDGSECFHKPVKSK